MNELWQIIYVWVLHVGTCPFEFMHPGIGHLFGLRPWMGC